jgi:hypothetical protein
MTVATNIVPLKQRTSEISDERIMQFQLANETWDSACIDYDINNTLNSCLCTSLNVFEASHPVTYKSYVRYKQEWLDYTRNKSIL